MKRHIICLLMILSLFFLCQKVEALDSEYGLYCAYGDYYFLYTGGHRNDVFNLESNFDGLGIAIEAGRPGKIFSDSNEQSWLREKNLIDSNGDFNCPSNPFGTQVGQSTAKECGSEGCHIVDVASIDESYSCNYIGQKTGGNLKISYVLNNNYINGKFDIIYPNGTTKTLIGTEANGNLLPNENCEDIYYIAGEKKIQVAIRGNSGVSNNVTLGSLCERYKDDQIEHFCSGSCTYSEMSCPTKSDFSSVNGCPKNLVPAFRLIKKIITPLIQIGIPILLILMGSIDFARAVMANDEKSISEATSRFLRRCIAAVAVFFVVTIVNLLMSFFNKTDIGPQTEWRSCWEAANE